MVRVAAVLTSIFLPTISAFTTVCPVASAIEAMVKIISGMAATMSKWGVPNGRSAGTPSTGPAATPSTGPAAPVAKAMTVPATSPSSTDSWARPPRSTRKKSTVQPMVASARRTPLGWAKPGEPGCPVISSPETLIRFTPMITIIVPITTVGKYFSSRANTGSATK
jgi:hypothetical protein